MARASLGCGGRRWRQRVAETLDLLGLSAYAEHPPAVLGYGLRRQVALASVLAMETPVLALDEPTAGLDRGAAGTPAGRDRRAPSAGDDGGDDHARSALGGALCAAGGRLERGPPGRLRPLPGGVGGPRPLDRGGPRSAAGDGAGPRARHGAAAAAERGRTLLARVARV